MAEVTREYNAIVWVKGSEKPPERLTVQARDKAEAERLIRERYGEQVFKCSVWNEDELARTWTRPRADDRIKEYTAIVWPKDDPSKPGQRVTLHARGLDEATNLLKDMFVGTEIVYSLWNEEDANRRR